MFARTMQPYTAEQIEYTGSLIHPDHGGGTIAYTLTELSDDPDEQVAQTIDAMGAWAIKAASSPRDS